MIVSSYELNLFNKSLLILFADSEKQQFWVV